MGDELIAGLGTRGSWIRAAPNLEQRDLTADEMALVEAIGGSGSQIRDLLTRSGLSEPRAIALLLGLRLRGFVQPMAPPPESARYSAPTSPPVQTYRPPPPVSPAAPPPPRPDDSVALAEEVELDEARKKEILDFDARLESDHYFALLGVPQGSSANECKKAYYELTKRFHPDRYFGKNIGSFKQRIDRIFRKLTEVQSVLSESDKRRAYLGQHPDLAAPPAPPPSAATGRRRDEPPPVDPKLAAERAAERRARLARHPYLAKQGKLHELLSRGRENLAKGEFAKAFTDLSLASQIEPKNKEIADLLAKAKKGNDKRRADSEFAEAVNAEKVGDTQAASTHYKTAVGLEPDNADYAHRAARALLSVGGASELKDAHNLARKASELAPRNVEYHLTFARVLVKAGLDKNAAREYEAVLKLDPDNGTAKEQLKKLK